MTGELNAAFQNIRPLQSKAFLGSDLMGERNVVVFWFNRNMATSR